MAERDSFSTDRDHPAPRSQIVEPRDAATLIVVDFQGSTPRVLMGRRRPDLKFMPNKYVFPGGRCEDTDATPPSATELHIIDQKKLLVDMKGTPSASRARALAMAAIRETFEETGIVLGERATPPSGSIPAEWQNYFALGVIPKLDKLKFFARAITPENRPRRFDTRFFYTTTEHIAERISPPDDELHDIGWHDLNAIRELDLPNITRLILQDLIELIDAGLSQSLNHPVPYYYFNNEIRARDMITI